MKLLKAVRRIWVTQTFQDTERAKRWAAVKHLDANNATRLAVIAKNKASIAAALGRKS